MAEDEATYGSEEEDTTLRDSGVVEKYKMAGAFCNIAMKAVVEKCVIGASVLELAKLGDQLILDQTEKVFNKGKGDDKIEKGMSFPTCINVNQNVCHYSPENDDTHAPLADGDVVKIDLGCHIDGFCAVIAHTVIIQADMSAPVKASPESNVVAAAAAAAEAVTHCFRPGAKNQDITSIIQKIAADYDVTPVEGVLSHEMTRYIIDHHNVIAMKNCPEQKVLDHELEEATVWTLDVAFSSAPHDSKDAGKLRQEDSKTHVFKSALVQYNLKMKASREVYSEINKKFQNYPFSMRHLDPKKGRFGINECLKHDLVNPYPVLKSKPSETVAHFCSTILIKTNEIEKATGLPVQAIETDKKILDKEVLDACSKSLNLKKKKKKKSKK